MKNKLIIKGMAVIVALLFFTNCKKSTDNNKPVVNIPATGTGYVKVGSDTFTGNCILASTGEVQIINLTSSPSFVLRVLNIPQQSSGTFNFTLNTGTPEMEFNENTAANVSVQYGSGGLNVGQITKTGARSFQFSCTLYVIDSNGQSGTTPFTFTGAGSY